MKDRRYQEKIPDNFFVLDLEPKQKRSHYYFFSSFVMFLKDLRNKSTYYYPIVYICYISTSFKYARLATLHMAAICVSMLRIRFAKFHTNTCLYLNAIRIGSERLKHCGEGFIKTVQLIVSDSQNPTQTRLSFFCISFKRKNTTLD